MLNNFMRILKQARVTPLAKIATTRMLVQWAGHRGISILCTMMKISPRLWVWVPLLCTGRLNVLGWVN